MLSMVLGRCLVSFTLDTYAHALVDHKKEGMALIEELYSMEPMVQFFAYPTITTIEEGGTLRFEASNFPAFTNTEDVLQDGIQHIKIRLARRCRRRSGRRHRPYRCSSNQR